MRLNFYHSRGKQQERLMTKVRIQDLQLALTVSKDPMIFIKLREE